MHDFVIPARGRATPDGVYDVAAHAGGVNGGRAQDTAPCAVERIRRWGAAAGRGRYPQARQLLLTAAGGGRNGSRRRLWHWARQPLADETGLTITVSPFPPGTRQWNKSAPRLFSVITQHWRGKPLVSDAVILRLIAATTTTAGLTVESRRDTNNDPAGRKMTKEERDTVRLEPHAFHGEWNYSILPHPACCEYFIS